MFATGVAAQHRRGEKHDWCTPTEMGLGRNPGALSWNVSLLYGGPGQALLNAWGTVERVVPGSLMAVKTRAGVTVKGKLVSVTADVVSVLDSSGNRIDLNRDQVADVHSLDRLTRRSQQIAQSLNSSRKVPDLEHPDIQEVVEPPYRIEFRVGPARIDILTVFHSAQRPLF